MRVLELVPSAESTAYRGQVRALRQRGVDCVTLSVPGAHVPGQQSRSLGDYFRHLCRTLRAARRGFDLVHANQGVVAPTALAATGVPTVVSLWGTDLYGSLGPVSRACARVADATVVMSRQMAEDLGADCRIIPHGVDFDRFQPMDRRSARREIGWDDGRAHVLYPYDPARSVKNLPRTKARRRRRCGPSRRSRRAGRRYRRAASADADVPERRRRAPAHVGTRGLAQHGEGGARV